MTCRCEVVCKTSDLSWGWSRTTLGMKRSGWIVEGEPVLRVPGVASAVGLGKNVCVRTWVVRLGIHE